MKFLFSLFLISFYLEGNGQLKSIIDNKNIEYRIIKTPTILLDSNRVELSKTYISVVLTDSARSKLKCISYNEWMTLLFDKYTDWAANLCLHDVFKKDAPLYRLDMNREKWIDCCNLVDIKYWKVNLRSLLAKKKSLNN